MDQELMALRQARLQQLKQNDGSATGNNSSDTAGATTQTTNALAPFLEASALERLSRVALVRPDRQQAVETYLKQLIASGQLRHKINEDEIVQILNGIAKQESRQQNTKIIFNRKGDDELLQSDNSDKEQIDSEDDFFDED